MKRHKLLLKSYRLNLCRRARTDLHDGINFVLRGPILEFVKRRCRLSVAILNGTWFTL